MEIRLASPDEANALWRIRNLAIRYGCKDVYGASTIGAWTPDAMPAGFPRTIADNPFYVIDASGGRIPVATGFLDLKQQSVEAIFTLPDFMGRGLAGRILQAIKDEALKRGIRRLTLDSTPNACTFYQRHGFRVVREGIYHSPTAGELSSVEMACDLTE